jgi:SAM-dependent methyltransferase
MTTVKISFDAASDYDRFMGRWSRAIGEKFLDWLAPPREANWLDLGCGTGAFTALILRHCAPKSLIGIDPSPEQIAFARDTSADAEFRVGDAVELPFSSETFDVIASALVIHFISDRAKAFSEMARVLRPGGLVGGYTWKRTETTDFAAYAPMLRGVEAVGGEALRSATVPEGTAEGMRESLAAAGLTNVEATEIEVTQTFPSFEDYWEVQTLPFSPSGKSVARLDDAQRERLRELMRARMSAPDGSITYAACAIAGKAAKLRKYG